MIPSNERIKFYIKKDTLLAQCMQSCNLKCELYYNGVSNITSLSITAEPSLSILNALMTSF